MNRLFWKIFAWFWFALILISVCVGWGVKFYIELAHPLADRLPQAQVATVRLAFLQGDSPQALELLASLNEESKYPIFVINEVGRDVLKRPLPHFLQHILQRGRLDEHPRLITDRIELDNGHSYTIIAPKSPGLAGMEPLPKWLALLIALIVSTLVCVWLARALSTPIERLRNATNALAKGDLHVRVGPLKRTQDEFSELASDFDVMATRLETLVQGRQQLLRDVSHELRSPLARLQVALALARRKEHDVEGLNRIERDLNRLEELIGEVLTLSRLEAPYESSHWEDVDIVDLLGELIADNTLEAENKGCTLELQIRQEAIISGNRELLRRAIENILRNAIRHTSAGTRVTITLSITTTHQLIVEICDMGSGVPEDKLQTIFDPFVRVDNARERQSGGYGLGLSIAKKAVEMHSGSLEASNRSDTPGLCMTITLPLTKQGVA